MFGRLARSGTKRLTPAAESATDGADAYEGLGVQALNAFGNDLVAAAGKSTDPDRAGVVDVPAGNGGFATLLALRRGTASLS
jgi:hypothetical protein